MNLSHMRYRSLLILFIICLISIVFLGWFIIDNTSSSETIVTFTTSSGKYSFICEVANNDSLRNTGLLKADSLDLDKGMLFIYDEPGMKWYTMIDMKFDLDIIFINETMNVVHVAKVAINDSYISSMYPVQYVVEINSGLASQYQITTGTTVEIMHQ